MTSQNIHTFVRLKPSDKPILTSDKPVVSIVNNKTVSLSKSNNETFEFQFAFDEYYTNQQVFNKTTAAIVRQAIKGYNSCIFTYGQTCSGKTFTMRGNQQNPGIIPLTIQQIFKIANDPAQRLLVEMRISYLQIYNENINDLLNQKNTNLEIREDNLKNLSIPNLTQIKCTNLKESIQCFHQGQSSRKISSTITNQYSSRSHTIFRINLEVIPKDKIYKKLSSVINLVDLAGSEGVSKTKAEGNLKKQGQNINKSLLALSNVIRNLSDKSTYINYRDSKLTRILQASLGGNSKTAVICTINSSFQNLAETISTLNFGKSAGQVKLKARVNMQQLEGNDSINQQRQYKVQRDFNVIKTDIEESEIYKKLKKENDQLVDSLEQKNKNIKQLIEDNQKLRNKILYLEEKLTRKNQQLELNSQILRDRQNQIQSTIACNSKISKILEEKLSKESKSSIPETISSIEFENVLTEKNKLKQLIDKLQSNQKILLKKVDLLEKKARKSQSNIPNLKGWDNIDIDPIKLQKTFQLHIKLSQKNRQVFETKKQNSQLLAMINQMSHSILELQQKIKQMEEVRYSGRKQQVSQKEFRIINKKYHLIRKQLSNRKRKQERYLSMIRQANEKILHLEDDLLNKTAKIEQLPKKKQNSEQFLGQNYSNSLQESKVEVRISLGKSIQ